MRKKLILFIVLTNTILFMSSKNASSWELYNNYNGEQLVEFYEHNQYDSAAYDYNIYADYQSPYQSLNFRINNVFTYQYIYDETTQTGWYDEPSIAFDNNIQYEFGIKSGSYSYYLPSPPYEQDIIQRMTTSLPESITIQYSISNEFTDASTSTNIFIESMINEAKIVRYNISDPVHILNTYNFNISDNIGEIEIHDVTPDDRFRLIVANQNVSAVGEYNGDNYFQINFETLGQLKIISDEPVWAYSDSSNFSGSEYYRAWELVSDKANLNEYLRWQSTGNYDPTFLNHTYYQGHDETSDPRVVANHLVLAELQGVTGEYNLHRGSLQTISSLVGEEGTGIFTQTGGTHETEHLLIQAHYNGDASGGSGTYIKTDGTLDATKITNNGEFKHYGGELVSNEFINNGYFQGVGTLDIGTFVNNGILAPGNSPGDLIINGNLIQNGKLIMELVWDEDQDVWLTDALTVNGLIEKGTSSLLEIAFRGVESDALLEQEFSLSQYFNLQGNLGLADLFEDVSITTLGWIMQTNIDPLETGGTFTITGKTEAPAVPIPGAVWLLGSALLGLVGFRRKRAL